MTRVRADQREYFANILRSAHGSVLEHANYSLVMRNVSRVFTHELVRHRAGSAFSQESLRYVRLTDIGFRVPPALEPVRERVLSIVEQLEEFQLDAAKELGIDDDGVPFHVKKEVTSALRRLAPIGLSTEILWTANARTLRHVIEMRTAEGAEEELRLVFDQVARIMQTAGARALSGFRPPGRRVMGARAPQGVKPNAVAIRTEPLPAGCCLAWRRSAASGRSSPSGSRPMDRTWLRTAPGVLYAVRRRH